MAELTATEVETGLIAACLAPYWQPEWGLLELVVETREYGSAGGFMGFSMNDDLSLRRLLHILEKHRDAYPFAVTFSMTHYDLGGGAMLWFPTREQPVFALEVYGYDDHDWAAEMEGRFSDFHPAFG